MKRREVGPRPPRFCVIACALADEDRVVEPSARYDLLLNYAGANPATLARLEPTCAFPGTKWAVLRRVLTTFDMKPYEYVWLPDPNLLLPEADIVTLFTVAEAQGLALAQPAGPLFPRDPACTLRFTNLVSLACPVFHVSSAGITPPPPLRLSSPRSAPCCAAS